MYIILYFLIMFAILGVIAVLNFKYKWITQDEVEHDPSISVIFLLVLVCWPITLAVGTLIGTIIGVNYVFIHIFLPKI